MARSLARVFPTALRTPLRSGLVVLFGLAIAGCGSNQQPESASDAELRAGKAPSAPELREIKDQANRLLDGGPEVVRGAPRGAARPPGRRQPVDVSWCTSCRYEFPFFQRQAAKYGDRVAFLGVDSQDSRDDAREFMGEFPTPCPHYYDPDASVARVFEGGRVWPTTAFYDSDGELARTRLGAYASEGELEADIERYALNG
jgi:thiol-disulfide isomerase/thioredoxin